MFMLKIERSRTDASRELRLSGRIQAAHIGDTQWRTILLGLERPNTLGLRGGGHLHNLYCGRVADFSGVVVVLPRAGSQLISCLISGVRVKKASVPIAVCPKGRVHPVFL